MSRGCATESSRHRKYWLEWKERKTVQLVRMWQSLWTGRSYRCAQGRFLELIHDFAGVRRRTEEDRPA